MKMEEPEYVVVARSLSEDAERIELPTEPDNKLGLRTLIGAFPGAHGLKYKNPTTGAFRALLIDSTGTKFHPPADGWSNKVFVVLSQAQSTTQENTASSNSSNQLKKSDQNAKRRKLMVESDDAESCDSDAELVGKSRPEVAKRQQIATKQKRMMGNGSGTAKFAETEEEEFPKKIVDILVKGLPYELTDDQLRTHFEIFGKVVHCEVKSQKGSTGNRGYGFVQMADLESQDKVLKNKMQNIGGRECQVKIPYTKNALSSKVFVGQIKEGTTSIELKDFFNEEARKIDPESSVTDVYIPRPFRSFAFVTFSSPVVSKELIRKGQMNLGDQAIYISTAHSTRPSGHQDVTTQQLQFQQHRSNSFQLPPTNIQNSYSAEEMFGNEWYGKEPRRDAPINQNLITAPSAGIQPNRVVGPMFIGQGSSYQHQNQLPQIYTGTPPTPAVVAGSQMLNQLETLNLNNMGIGHEVVNAIKAIFSVAQTATTQLPQQQQQMVDQKQQHVLNSVQYQQQSLPAPPAATSGGSSPGRVYVPSTSNSQSLANNYQQKRRSGGGNGRSNNHNGNHGGGVWRD